MPRNKMEVPDMGDPAVWLAEAVKSVWLMQEQITVTVQMIREHCETYNLPYPFELKLLKTPEALGKPGQTPDTPEPKKEG